jgi:hypothetical protein
MAEMSRTQKCALKMVEASGAAPKDYGGICALQRLLEYCDQILACRRAGGASDLVGELDAHQEICRIVADHKKREQTQ